MTNVIDRKDRFEFKQLLDGASKNELEPLKEVSAPQTKLAKPMESMMNAFL